ALVSTPELKINEDEIDFVRILTPDGFHGRPTRIKRGSVGRKSSHKGSSSRAGRESRHSLSTCHSIGWKSEGHRPGRLSDPSRGIQTRHGERRFGFVIFDQHV